MLSSRNGHILFSSPNEKRIKWDRIWDNMHFLSYIKQKTLLNRKVLFFWTWQERLMTVCFGQKSRPFILYWHTTRSALGNMTYFFRGKLELNQTCFVYVENSNHLMPAVFRATVVGDKFSPKIVYIRIKITANIKSCQFLITKLEMQRAFMYD